MGRISGRPWGFPVAAYGENLMATDTATGKKQNSVDPALQTIRHTKEQLGLRCVLAIWDLETREITQLNH
jgi:hypothetical protein